MKRASKALIDTACDRDSISDIQRYRSDSAEINQRVTTTPKFEDEKFCFLIGQFSAAVFKVRPHPELKSYLILVQLSRESY